MHELNRIKVLRLAEPKDSNHRMEAQCNSLPSEWAEEHGYHKACYKKFMRHLEKLHASPCSEPDTQPTTSHGSRCHTQAESILFRPDCIYCNSEARKKVKIQGSYTTEGLSSFDFGGGQNVQQIAEENMMKVF